MWLLIPDSVEIPVVANTLLWVQPLLLPPLVWGQKAGGQALKRTSYQQLLQNIYFQGEDVWGDKLRLKSLRP